MPASTPFPTDTLMAELARALSSSAYPMHDIVRVPDRFVVIVRGEDVDDLLPIRSLLIEQAKRRLDEALDRLNTNDPPRARWWRRKQADAPAVTYSRGAPTWSIDLVSAETTAWTLPPEARFAILPEFGAAHGDELAGAGTQLFTPPATPAEPTDGGTVRMEALRRGPLAEGPLLARLTWTDEQGDHTYEWGASARDRTLKIGRSVDGSDWRDIPIHVEGDVSRDHARLRYASETGRFMLLDKSSFGTTIDGEAVPSSHGAYTTHTWTPLPRQAAIGLAGVVTLHFEQLG